MNRTTRTAAKTQSNSASRRRPLQVVVAITATALAYMSGYSDAFLLQQRPVSAALLRAVKENTDFDLAVGRALDTLKSDYPRILTENPDFSIYDEQIECIDPSGVKVTGLRNYKASFGLIHALVKLVYCPAKSGITFRLCHDKARNNIRIHWNVEVVPREIFGGRQHLFVDGISVYAMNNAGNITQHRIEHLLFNDKPVMPKEGVIAVLRREKSTATVPSYYKSDNTIVPFQSRDPLNFRSTQPSSSLFSLASSSSDEQEEHPGFDWEALKSKNKSRKKFGLKPLTPEEYLEIQTQVDIQAADQQRQLRELRELAAAPKKKKSLFERMASKINTCETNYDCARPEVCCDFGFSKRCCSSGSPVLKGALAPIRVVQGMQGVDPRQQRPR